MGAAKSTDTFNCPVCFQRYNESDHVPKSFPCGHSICLRCAEDLFVRAENKAQAKLSPIGISIHASSSQATSDDAASGVVISCPICRGVCQTHPTSLPTNNTILNAMQLKPVLPTPPVDVHECSMCKKTKRPVVKHCETCNLNLCQGHSEAHQDDHDDHVLQPTVHPTVSNMCPRHPKKELEFYCDCKKMICANCCVLDHATHTRLDIYDAFDKLKLLIESAASRSKIVCDEMNVMVDEYKNLERDLSAKETDIATSIEAMSQELKHCIDHRCDELISSLPSKRLAVESHRHNIESQSDQLSTCSQSAQVHLESDDKINCLSNADPLIDLLSSLDGETKSDDWRVVKYDSHLNLTCDFDGLKRSVSQFGELDDSNEILNQKKVCIRID